MPARSTGIAQYDRQLMAGVRTWVYTPFEVEGVAIPVCTTITFVYTQR
jgi:hypothetical protein